MKTATLLPFKAFGFVIWLVVCFSVPFFGAGFVSGDWYPTLNKPTWNPPKWAFAPVWTVLYTVMGIAAWMVWSRGGFRKQFRPLVLFLIQLFLNALWTPLFFGLHRPALAFADIVLLWLVLLGTVVAFWQIRALAGALLIPYVVWVTFAAALNFSIWQLNR